MGNTKERMKRLRAGWEAKGLCARCGKRPPVDGKKACAECLDKQREYYYRNKHNHATYIRQAKGLCVTCGKRPPMTGTYQGKPRRSCKQCNDERNRQGMLRRFKKYMPTFERDGYKCRLCGREHRLHVHHIDGNGSTSKQANDDPENLIVLCHHCHYGLHCLRQAKDANRELAVKLLLACPSLRSDMVV